MHAKSDSEVTSLAPSSPPRSPRRPMYYVMSPMSQHESTEKMSMGSSPPGSPPYHHQTHHPHHHRYYASSPIHHSRESSTTRFSASLRNGPWRKFPYTRGGGGLDEEAEDDDDEGDACGAGRKGLPPRCYALCFLLGFATLFAAFSLVLWVASKAYSPDISVKSVVFESYNLYPGMDATGVPTKMLSINATVKVFFRNAATFFGLHVSSTPLELYYSDLVLASGDMKEFYQSRKSQRVVTVRVAAGQVPVYGGGSGFTSAADGEPPANIPLRLAFVVRARAHVLGKLVKSKFYRRIRCSLALREAHLGKPLDPGGLCAYSG